MSSWRPHFHPGYDRRKFLRILKGKPIIIFTDEVLYTNCSIASYSIGFKDKDDTFRAEWSESIESTVYQLNQWLKKYYCSRILQPSVFLIDFDSFQDCSKADIKDLHMLKRIVQKKLLSINKKLKAKRIKYVQERKNNDATNRSQRPPAHILPK